MPSAVHSRPNAAIALGGPRKNWVFLRRRSSSSMSYGVGGPVRVGMRWVRSALCSRPKSVLLSGLVVRLVEESADPGVDAENGLRQGEFVFAGGQFVVDEGAGDPGFAGVAGRQ